MPCHHLVVSLVVAGGREGGTTAHSDYAHNDERGRLKGVPVGVVLDVVERRLARPERVKHLKHESSSTGTDEALPHGLVWEVVRDLLGGRSACLTRPAHWGDDASYSLRD